MKKVIAAVSAISLISGLILTGNPASAYSPNANSRGGKTNFQGCVVKTKQTRAFPDRYKTTGKCKTIKLSTNVRQNSNYKYSYSGKIARTKYKIKETRVQGIPGKDAGHVWYAGKYGNKKVTAKLTRSIKNNPNFHSGMTWHWRQSVKGSIKIGKKKYRFGRDAFVYGQTGLPHRYTGIYTTTNSWKGLPTKNKVKALITGVFLQGYFSHSTSR